MRNTYYQSSGNPIQIARLPATRPTIEFLAAGKSRSEALRRAAASVAIMAFASIVTLVLLEAGQLLTWFEPFDWLFCGPTLLAGVAIAISQRNIAVLVHPTCLIAWVVACLSPQTPPVVRIGLIAVFASLTISLLGSHWATIATAFPVSRDAMRQCRSRCRWQLLLMACIVGALLFAVLSRMAGPWPVVLAALPVAVLLMPTPHGLTTSRWSVAFEAILSWWNYETRSLPGLVQSPIPSARHRSWILVVACILTTAAFHHFVASRRIEAASQSVSRPILAQKPSPHFGYVALAILVNVGAAGAIPVVTALTIITAAAAPALLDAAAERDSAHRRPGNTHSDLRSSPDRIERRSILHGHVVFDGSPVLIPREVHQEHCHALGDSGSGKTALFLCPLIEQLVGFGDCSVVVLDLKGDSLELLGSLQAAGEAVGQRTGRPLPLKFFSNQRNRTTFAFNPMAQPFWRDFDLLTQTDILCAASGLTYGTDYGSGWYSSANAAVFFHTLKTFPNVKTFAELADCIGTVLTVAKKRELHPEVRRAGVHVHEVVKRFAACEALNVSNTTGHAAAAVEQAIDLTQLFREPQLLHCHLPATLTPSQAPEIARLFTYMLLAAATQTERLCPVFLVIDEFQRMVANNLEYMLQLARSMGVGVILANQSMQDLRKGNVDLIPAIEANCRLRQWFSVSSDDDQQRLIRSSGLTVETMTSHSRSVNSDGKSTTGVTQSEHIAPRLTINDVLLANDHPFRSILRVSRGAGYTQFGGMPVIIESQFHISPEEYDRRKRLPWPSAEGAIQPQVISRTGEEAALSATAEATGMQWSEEVIGPSESVPLSDQGKQDMTALFDSLRTDLDASSARRREGDKS